MTMREELGRERGLTGVSASAATPAGGPASARAGGRGRSALKKYWNSNSKNKSYYRLLMLKINEN